MLKAEELQGIKTLGPYFKNVVAVTAFWRLSRITSASLFIPHISVITAWGFPASVGWSVSGGRNSTFLLGVQRLTREHHQCRAHPVPSQPLSSRNFCWNSCRPQYLSVLFTMSWLLLSPRTGSKFPHLYAHRIPGVLECYGRKETFLGLLSPSRLFRFVFYGNTP